MRSLLALSCLLGSALAATAPQLPGDDAASAVESPHRNTCGHSCNNGCQQPCGYCNIGSRQCVAKEDADAAALRAAPDGEIPDEPIDASVGFPGECGACEAAMQATFDMVFNAELCRKGIETAVKLACKLTGPFSAACKGFVTGICTACRHASKGHCSWRQKAVEECKAHHFCH